MHKRRLSLIAVIGGVLFCRCGWSQDSEIRVKGQVSGGDPLELQRAVILTDLHSRRTLSADVQGDGTFEVPNVPRGNYELTVLNEANRAVFEEFVSLQGSNQSIDVRLPRHNVERPPSGSVPVNQLLHPPAKKAIQAFLAARKFADSHQYEKAAEQLEKAVAISPDYADAWVNLAAQHLRLGNYQQSLDELARASEISGPSALILTNKAVAKQALRRDAEAIASARQSLQMDASYVPAHLVLGLLLASDRRTLPEAVSHLEIAARTIPSAGQALDQARRDLAMAVSHP